jgi:hypothetical protein
MRHITPILFLATLVHALPESAYQNWWAAKVGGKTEVVAGDRTRCDILTNTHAIEVDFGKKWAEAIGQSLNYSFQFNRKAGILLILENSGDQTHLFRLQSIIRHHKLPIDVWTVKAGEVQIAHPRLNASSGDAATKGKFWITSTGKTHNSKCRYFGTTKTGKWSIKGSGNNCRVCGEAR